MLHSVHQLAVNIICVLVRWDTTWATRMNQKNSKAGRCKTKTMSRKTLKCSAKPRTAELGDNSLLLCYNEWHLPYLHIVIWVSYLSRNDKLTSSSLNQERLSAVSTNQYSLAPPFMMLMLLMVSQPLRMTCGKGMVNRVNKSCCEIK